MPQSRSVPEQGQLALVRQRRYVVTDIRQGATPSQLTGAKQQHLIKLSSIEDDALGEELQVVWEIERKLAEDAARPAIFYPMSAACWQPYFKGHTMMVNGNYNNWRFEDAWLDR